MTVYVPQSLFKWAVHLLLDIQWIVESGPLALLLSPKFAQCPLDSRISGPNNYVKSLQKVMEQQDRFVP